MNQLPCVTTTMRGRPCVIRGQHLEACLWAQCEEAAVVEGVTVGILLQARQQVGLPVPRPCHGCVPRPAQHGMLCDSCWSKWVAALDVAASLMTHLRAVQRGQQSVDGVRTAQGSKVIVPASWLAADQLWSLLSTVVIAYAGQSRTGEPEWPDWTRVAGGQHRRPRLDGFGVQVTIEQVAKASSDLVRWVAESPTVIVSYTDAAVAAVDFFRALQTVLHRFPIEDSPVDMPRLRCRRCGMFSVRQHPPLRVLADPLLECDVCGFEADPLLVDWDLKLYAQEVWEGMTSEQQANIRPDLTTDERRVLRELDRTDVETMRAKVWERLGDEVGKVGPARAAWFNLARAEWGGLTADQMIEAGRGQEVLNLIGAAA